MAQAQSSKRTPQFRTGRIIASLVVLIALVIAGRWFYYYQRDQNTLRLMNEADAAYDHEDWPAAIEAYGVYVNRDPFNEHALRRYAELLLDRSDVTPQAIGEATRALRRLLQVDANDVEAMKRLTGIYFLINELDLAEQMTKRWHEAAPDDPDATAALCEAYRRQKQPDDAVALLTSAVKGDDADPVYYALLVEVYLTELKDAKIARHWMEKGLAKHADSPDIQMAAFMFYRNQKDAAQADTHLRLALSGADDRMPLLLSGAGFYIDQNRLDDASNLLDRAEKIDPANRRLLKIRGSWALRRGTPDAMREAAVKLEALGKDDDGELLALGAELYCRAGDFDKVDAFVEKLRPIARRDEKAQTWIEVLRGARMLLSGDAYAAVPHLENALRRNPDHAWTMELLALAYTRTGAADEAAELYRRLSLRAPASASIELALARLSWQQGDPQGALDHLDAMGSSVTASQRQLADLIETVCRIDLLDADKRDSGTATGLAKRLADEESTASADPSAVQLLASGYVALKQPDRVVGLADRLAHGTTVDPTAIAEAGHVLAGAGELTPAEKIAKTLIESHPKSGAGFILAARCRAHEGGAEEAEHYVDGLEVSDEIKGRAMAAIGDVVIAKDDGTQALPVLRRAVKLLPDNVSTRQTLIRRTDDADEANRLVDQIEKIEGEAGLTWRYERAAFLARTDPSKPALRKALALVKECLDARPSWTAALLVRGLAQERLGRWDEAVDAYRTAISQQPRLARGDVAIRLVGLLKKLGRFAEADSIVATLAKSRPQDSRVLRMETERYLRKRQLASAVKSAENLLAVNRTDSNWAAFTADLQLRSGNAKRAEEIAKDGLARDARSTALLWSMARALVAQGRAEDAERCVQDSAERLNDSGQFLVLAQLRSRLNRKDDAVAALERALTIAPDDPTVNAAASDFWAAQGDRAKQIEYARKTIKLRDKNPSESVTLAKLLASGGSADDLKEAGAIVNRRLASNNNDVDALVLSARLAATAEPPELGRAEKQLTTALKADPRSQAAHKLLATVQARQGELNEARNTVEVGLSFAPDDPDLLRTAGELHIHRGEFAAAVAPLRRLVELNAETSETVLMLATAYRETGRIDRALDLLQERIKQDLATPGEYVALAELYETTMNFDQAEATFATAIERDGADGLAFQRFVSYLARRNEYARIYSMIQERQTRFPNDIDSLAVAAEVLASSADDPELKTQGRSWLDEIIEHHADHAADAAFRAGMTCYRHQEFVEAEKYFKKSAQRAPDAPRPVNALAWLYFHERKSPADALAIVERFLEQGGKENAEMLDTHAAILLSLKQYEEAQRLLTKCLALAGQAPTLTAANYRMGLVLNALGRKEESDTYLRQAVLLDDRLTGLLPEELSHANELLAR